MNFGLVVESERDCSAYAILIAKIRDDIAHVIAIPCGNDAEVKKQFPAWLRHFQWHAQYPIGKALIIRDSDRADPEVIEEEMQREFDRLQFRAFPVHLHATRRELETWLLADENAINTVSRQRGKNRQVGAVNFNLEEHEYAKERFQEQLSDAGLPDTPAVYGEIAAAADVMRIATRCPLFQRFEDKVRAC